jgi:predicted RNase H-like HicB family nuclease
MGKFKNRYLFPAIFTVDDDGISIEFPDLPNCLTCGDTEEEAVLMAKDALELHLYGMEEEGQNIPESTKVNRINTDENQFVVMIDVYMPPIRDEMALRSIKKTLTIPKWLNDIAEQKAVNFSFVLQKALKQHLGVRDYEDKQ